MPRRWPAASRPYPSPAPITIVIGQSNAGWWNYAPADKWNLLMLDYADEGCRTRGECIYRVQEDNSIPHDANIELREPITEDNPEDNPEEEAA